MGCSLSLSDSKLLDPPCKIGAIKVPKAQITTLVLESKTEGEDYISKALELGEKYNVNSVSIVDKNGVIMEVWLKKSLGEAYISSYRSEVIEDNDNYKVSLVYLEVFLCDKCPLSFTSRREENNRWMVRPFSPPCSISLNPYSKIIQELKKVYFMKIDEFIKTMTEVVKDKKCKGDECVFLDQFKSWLDNIRLLRGKEVYVHSSC